MAMAAAAMVLGWLLMRSFAGPLQKPIHQLPQLWLIGILPFAGLLIAIAVLPLLGPTRSWWESNRNRLMVSLCFAGLTIAYYVCFAAGAGRIAQGAALVPEVLQHAVVGEYLPFMVLLLSLFVISGGINVTGDLPAHPLTNTIFLAAGTLLASIIGTTGASMLLIRPLLQTNSQRRHVTHTVIFFIFLVSNIGGCLLPIGDPPLFLGYLQGVSFLWTLGLWKQWALCSGILLLVYLAWDSRMYRREPIAAIRRDEALRVPLRLIGWINFIWLGGVVAAVAFLDDSKFLPGTHWQPFKYMRELCMLGCIVMSLLTTPRSARQANGFNYAAILEVAALFIGIFITMQVPIAVLSIKGGSLGLTQPWHFFWATGGLSSFLDNAPTYLVFLETASAMAHAPGDGVVHLLDGRFIRTDFLSAISLGAVFMGANTYIGNGPNFMVKSIAEQSGVRMPSFLGFMLYSAVVLIPLFILVTFLLP